jgi:hypothetical protein
VILILAVLDWLREAAVKPVLNLARQTILRRQLELLLLFARKIRRRSGFECLLPRALGHVREKRGDFQ